MEIKNGSKRQINSKKPGEWTNDHQTIINDLVDYLKSPAFISYPDFSLPFVVHCDISSGAGRRFVSETRREIANN